MNISEAEINAQLDVLKTCAAKTFDPCISAQYISFSDERVHKVFLQKLKQGNVFTGISCLNGIGIPEQKRVLFSFECPPGIFCLINPSFVAVVNFIERKVVAVIDPFLEPVS